ncbi:hypothetical protein MRX96_015727 [Rhipicephalus microplus]
MFRFRNARALLTFTLSLMEAAPASQSRVTVLWRRLAVDRRTDASARRVLVPSRGAAARPSRSSSRPVVHLSRTTPSIPLPHFVTAVISSSSWRSHPHRSSVSSLQCSSIYGLPVPQRRVTWLQLLAVCRGAWWRFLWSPPLSGAFVFRERGRRTISARVCTSRCDLRGHHPSFSRRGCEEKEADDADVGIGRRARQPLWIIDHAWRCRVRRWPPTVRAGSYISFPRLCTCGVAHPSRRLRAPEKQHSVHFYGRLAPSRVWIQFGKVRPAWRATKTRGPPGPGGPETPPASINSRTQQLQTRSASGDRLSDCSTRSSSGRGYMCDSESDSERASDAGSDLFSGPAHHPNQDLLRRELDTRLPSSSIILCTQHTAHSCPPALAGSLVPQPSPHLMNPLVKNKNMSLPRTKVAPLPLGLGASAQPGPAPSSASLSAKGDLLRAPNHHLYSSLPRPHDLSAFPSALLGAAGAATLSRMPVSTSSSSLSRSTASRVLPPPGMSPFARPGFPGFVGASPGNAAYSTLGGLPAAAAPPLGGPGGDPYRTLLDFHHPSRNELERERYRLLNHPMVAFHDRFRDISELDRLALERELQSKLAAPPLRPTDPAAFSTLFSPLGPPSPYLGGLAGLAATSRAGAKSGPTSSAPPRVPTRGCRAASSDPLRQRRECRGTQQRAAFTWAVISQPQDELARGPRRAPRCGALCQGEERTG